MTRIVFLGTGKNSDDSQAACESIKDVSEYLQLIMAICNVILKIPDKFSDYLHQVSGSTCSVFQRL